MKDSDNDFLLDKIAALESFIEEFLPPLIAASAARAQLEAQLQALADQETDSALNPELHWKASLAEDVLKRLPAG